MPNPTLATPCPRCGKERDWHGVCPACVLQGALDPPPPTPISLPSPQVPGYEVREELGRGGMGVVWRARQTTLERWVALKVLRPGLGESPVARERFRREAAAAARLEHPGIVTVHEFGEWNGEMFLVMELVEGQSLAQHLRTGPLPPESAARLTRALADIVDAAHTRGVIHRDLRPANILLTANQLDAPRLTDFGIAQLIGGDPAQLTVTLEGIGTLAYLAPEQIHGRKTPPSPALDLYGLGAILYHTLVGQPPFQADSLAALLHAIAEKAPVSTRQHRPEIPTALDTICLRCLAKSPARRYSTAAELREDLDRFLAGLPITSRRSPWPERFRDWRAVPRRTVAVLTLGALASALAWGYRTRSRPPSSTRSLPPIQALLNQWPPTVPPPAHPVHFSPQAASALAYSPDGQWLAVGDANGTVQVLASDRTSVVLSNRLSKSVRDFAWSADSRWLLGSDAAGQWRLWTSAPGWPLHAEDTVGFRIDATAVTADGERWFASSADSLGRLWRRQGTGMVLVAKCYLPDGAWGTSFNRAGDRLLTVCPNGLVNLWNGRTGLPVKTLTTGGFGAASFSPDGTLALVTPTRTPSRTELARLQSADGSELLPRLVFDGPLTAFAFSPEGSRLAVALGARVVLHPLTTDAPPSRTLTTDASVALTLFSTDGLRLLTCSDAGLIQLWDALSGTLLAGPIVNAHLFWRNQLCPKRNEVAGAGSDGRIRLWDVSPRPPTLWGTPTEWREELARTESWTALRWRAWANPGDPGILRRLGSSPDSPDAPIGPALRQWLIGLADSAPTRM